MQPVLWNPLYDTTGRGIGRRDKSSPELFLSADIFRTAKQLYQEEQINPNDDNQVFRGLIYCVLTPSSTYENQVAILKRFEEQQLTTPQAIASYHDLSSLITGVIYNKQTASRMQKLAGEWWPQKSQTFLDHLRQNIAHGREGTHVRQELINDCPGIAYKCASLFMRMCDYMQFVPLDRWALRFATDVIGMKLPGTVDARNIFRGKRNNIQKPTVKQYLRAEKAFRKYAEEMEIRPAALQMLLYVHRTNWKKADLNYLRQGE